MPTTRAKAGTDISYIRDIALANILHAQHVPMRGGKPLGETQFRNMHAAYEDLPSSLKHKLKGRRRRTTSTNMMVDQDRRGSP